MGILSDAFTAAKQKRVRKIAKILIGEFTKGDRVKVVRMPPERSVYWLDEWMNLEGIYLGPATTKEVSRVFFEGKDSCNPITGWLVHDAQLEHM